MAQEPSAVERMEDLQDQLQDGLDDFDSNFERFKDSLEGCRGQDLEPLEVEDLKTRIQDLKSSIELLQGPIAEMDNFLEDYEHSED